MKASVKLYESDGEQENGFPVKIIVSHKTKIRRRTIAHAKIKQWDFRRNNPSPYHPDYDDLLDLIRSIRDKAQKRAFKALEDVDEALSFLMVAPKEKAIDFLKYGKDLADQIEPTNPGNARAWRIALKELEKVEPHVHFKDLSTVFFERFKRFQRGKKNTTIRAYLYALKAIYSDAVKLAVTEDAKPFEGIFKDLKVRKRRARNAYFEKDDLKVLKEAEFTQHNYTIARDLALLQFYLCGLDLTDVIHIEKSHIKKNRLNIMRNKLGEKGYWFDILIPEPAREILERYQGEGKYQMYFAEMYHYPTFRVKMYRCLQQVKKLLKIELTPKDNTFTWKVMRHSFATLGKFERIEEDLLRELMGHERNDIDTVYKDKYPESERNEAQLRIISI